MDRDNLIKFLQSLPEDVLILGTTAEDGGLCEVGWDTRRVLPSTFPNHTTGEYTDRLDGEEGLLAVVFE